MLKNYFKTALRSLLKNKVFSSINIVGLAVGMAACLLILQYVSFHLSFDRFNANIDNLYRVVNDRYQNGKLVQHGTITYSAIGKALQDDYPEVVNHARVMPFSRTIVITPDKKIGDQNVVAVDNSFLSMFSYALLVGDKRTALQQPHTAMLTKSLASKIFDVKGNDFSAVVGKTFLLGNDSTPYKITGVLADAPENSHLRFDALASYATVYSGPNAYKEADYDFTQSDFWHYIQLKPGADYRRLNEKLDAFSQRHFQGNKISGSDEKFSLQPLSKAHLYSDFEYEIGETKTSTTVWGLLIIALLIIVIAWVNYINLTTAKSLERAKEVGVRKVAGASKSQLIRQFLSEAVAINIIALLLALTAVFLVQSSFNRLVQYNLSLSYLFEKGFNGYSISVLVIAMLLAGILVSGFYPSFVLSSFRPILVLKGKFITSRKGIVLRKALVIGQFAITIALITGSFVVYKQMNFMNGQDLGMNISQMLIVRPPELTSWDSTFITRENSFTESLKQLPKVEGATTSWNVPGGETGRSFNVRRIDQDSTTSYTMRHTAVSNGYVDLYKMKIVAGRDFTYTDFNPSFGKLHNLLLNENATKLLGYKSPQDAIGKTIVRGKKQWDVIGVIKDYHQKSLRYAVEPTMIFPAYSTNSLISVKVATSNLSGTIAAIKKQYESFFPGNLFDYYFLDERFNQQYTNEKLFGKVFALFSGFAILIACLGLFGLALFATAQRTKEIGIRKVLGASVSSILTLLSKDFIRLVLIAFVIASPVAWFVMHKWLDDFAYRISISGWIFLAAGLLAVIIAIGTISLQALKTAMANPVKSLRSE